MREGAFETAQRCLSENTKAKGISVFDQPKRETILKLINKPTYRLGLKFGK